MKKTIYLLLAVLVGLTLVSCKGSNNNGDNGTIKNLIVYTNQTSGGRGTQLQKMVKDQNFDFKVTFAELSGQNLKDRLIVEKGSPIADVVLGGGILEHLELKEQGVTTPYIPSWIDKVSEEHTDVDGFYSPWAVEPLYLVYNKAHYTSDPTKVTNKLKLAPTGWVDLASNFKDKYNVFKPTSGTGATIYASILSEYRDTNGEFGISDAGWTLLGELMNNGEIDRGLWQTNLAGDEKPIAMTWAGAIIEIEKAYDVEIGIVKPEEGVPVVVSQIAVINSKNEARISAAQEFVEWWGQTDVQVAWSEISGQAPANLDAYELVNEDIKVINDTKVLPLDWPFISTNISNWRQKIELDIIK